jgi:hypothetical protein
MAERKGERIIESIMDHRAQALDLNTVPGVVDTAAINEWTIWKTDGLDYADGDMLAKVINWENKGENWSDDTEDIVGNGFYLTSGIDVSDNLRIVPKTPMSSTNQIIDVKSPLAIRATPGDQRMYIIHDNGAERSPSILDVQNTTDLILNDRGFIKNRLGSSKNKVSIVSDGSGIVDERLKRAVIAMNGLVGRKEQLHRLAKAIDDGKNPDIPPELVDDMEKIVYGAQHSDYHNHVIAMGYLRNRAIMKLLKHGVHENGPEVDAAVKDYESTVRLIGHEI